MRSILRERVIDAAYDAAFIAGKADSGDGED
jgi:hypothetical protein